MNGCLADTLAPDLGGIQPVTLRCDRGHVRCT